MRYLIIISLIFSVSLNKNHAQQSVAINQYMEEVMAVNPSPGISIAAIKDGKIVHLSGYGKAMLGNNQKMTESSSMDIGSITKSMTALAVMQLVEKGQIILDAPVIKYLPWFRTANKEKSDLITIRMLLNNTSGIVNAAKSTEGNESMTKEAMEKIVQDLSTFYLELTPGQSYAYSNYGFHIAGLIVTEVSGMAYWDYMKEKIFRPLEMNRTSVDPKEFNQWTLYDGHGYGANEVLPYPKKKQSVAFLPAGRMTKSNAKDMANYMMMMLNKGKFDDQQIISSGSIKKLIHKEINFQGMSTFIGCEGEDWHYGLGWMMGNIDGTELVFHGGSSGTTSSLMLLNPAKKMGVFVLSNLDHSFLNPFKDYSNDITIANNILRLLEGKPLSNFGRTCQKDETKNSYNLPKGESKNYIGTYKVSSGGEDLFLENATFHIEQKGQQLIGNFRREGRVLSAYEIDFTNPIVAVIRSGFSRPGIFRFLRKANGEIIGCDFGHSQYRKQEALTGIFQQYTYKSFSLQLSEEWEVTESDHEWTAQKGESQILFTQTSKPLNQLLEKVNHQGNSKSIIINNQRWEEQIISTTKNGMNRMHWVLRLTPKENGLTIVLSSPASSFYKESHELLKSFFNQNL